MPCLDRNFPDTSVYIYFYRKLRRREANKFRIQLCIALLCMLVIFVAGIDRTSVYGVCVAVSALIHYFTLVAVMWMGAEAVLMFRKVVIVFSQTTTKFITAVSLICWCKWMCVWTTFRDVMPSCTNNKHTCCLCMMACCPCMKTNMHNIASLVPIVSVAGRWARNKLDYSLNNSLQEKSVRCVCVCMDG